MSQYPSFCHTFPIFLSKHLTTSPEEMFFMDIEKPSTFIMVKKGIKSNHNNCCLITDLFPSYILIEFTIF